MLVIIIWGCKFGMIWLYNEETIAAPAVMAVDKIDGLWSRTLFIASHLCKHIIIYIYNIIYIILYIYIILVYIIYISYYIYNFNLYYIYIILYIYDYICMISPCHQLPCQGHRGQPTLTQAIPDNNIRRVSGITEPLALRHCVVHRLWFSWPLQRASLRCLQ